MILETPDAQELVHSLLPLSCNAILEVAPSGANVRKGVESRQERFEHPGGAAPSATVHYDVSERRLYYEYNMMVIVRDPPNPR
jgi:hypothetical protein